MFSFFLSFFFHFFFFSCFFFFSFLSFLLTSNQERILSLTSQSHWSHSDRDMMSFHKTIEPKQHECASTLRNNTQAESRRRRRLLTQDVQMPQEEGTETEQHGTRNGAWKRCMSQHPPSDTARFRAVSVRSYKRLFQLQPTHISFKQHQLSTPDTVSFSSNFIKCQL